MFEQDMQEILYSRDVLDARIAELGAQITADYRGRDLLVIGVLRGAFIFMADLVRHIELPLTLDFVRASSYGNGTESAGTVLTQWDLAEKVEGRDILLVEDILETGNTLHQLKEDLKGQGAASVRICVMLNKRLGKDGEEIQKKASADYTGFRFDSGFIVGCGLDYAQKYRQLPYIGILKPEIYEKKEVTEA